MLKYRGRYRVLCEADIRGISIEFTCIPCGIKKGANICRHSDTMLNAFIPSTKIIHRLIKEYPEIFTLWQEGYCEGTIIFPETEIDKVAKLLKATKKGKGKPVRLKTNYSISDKRRKELSEQMKERNKQKWNSEGKASNEE